MKQCGGVGPSGVLLTQKQKQDIDQKQIQLIEYSRCIRKKYLECIPF